MKPTNELRFVEREVVVSYEGRSDLCLAKTVRILQQKWIAPEGAINTEDEWRDVPVEKE